MKTMVKNKDILYWLEELGEILGATTEGAPEFRRVPISGIKIDSRQVEGGDLFVAIKGENHDGHDYLKSAFKNGAAAALVSKETADTKGITEKRVIKVKDTVFALGEIARNYRNKMPAKVIAVTGSNGKTTVKDLIFEVLSRKAPSIKSMGNYNNYFGLPLSIFQLEEDIDYAVFELGMSAAGEISRLGEIASPDLAVITNIGPVHLEFFSSLDDIARAKLEIIDSIRPGGTLVVNGDDDYLRDVNVNRELRTIKFGLSYNNDFYPTDLNFGNNQLPVFKIEGTEFRLKLPGVHNVYNALAAYCVAISEGIDPATAANAINDFLPEGMRSRVIEKSAVTYFIDCYNANPVSMKYSIDTLALMQCEGRRIAVLGDMLELGKLSEKYHKEIGRHAKKAGLDYLLAYGSLSKYMAEEFGRNGEYFDTKEDLYLKLKELVKDGDLVLFKGSRAMALEEISDRLTGKM